MQERVTMCIRFKRLIFLRHVILHLEEVVEIRHTTRLREQHRNGRR